MPNTLYREVGRSFFLRFAFGALAGAVWAAIREEKKGKKGPSFFFKATKTQTRAPFGGLAMRLRGREGARRWKVVLVLHI